MEVRVYSNMVAFNNNKAIFVRSIPVCDGLSVDYTSVLKVMRMLFGDGCIVVFLCV